MMAVCAVVLAGGTSRRFGSDKLAAPLGDSTVLDHLLDGLPGPDDWVVVCVGPERATRRCVGWAREDPPGGGPVAAIAAGLATGHTADTDMVVVVAGDQPYAAAAALRLTALLDRSPDVDVVVAVDGHGRTNPLLAAYRVDALRAALPEDPAGRPARSLLDHLQVLTIRVSDDEGRDVDTTADLRDLAP